MQIKLNIDRYNTISIQQGVISYILVNLGEEITLIGTGARTRYNELCEKACELYLPKASKRSARTCRRWFDHYLKYGETPEETKNT